MKNKFKIGDRVKVSKKYQHLHNSCGEGTVIEIGSDYNRAVYVVKFDDKKFKLSLYSYQLEKADKPKKDKPIVMVEFREQDTVPHYDYQVGDKVLLTKEAIEWLKKHDQGKDIKEYLYDTVFEVTKRIVYQGDPAYYLGNCTSICFYDKDLKPAPLPNYGVGQKVWLTSKTIEQLKKDNNKVENVTDSFEIVGWHYYKGKVIYKLNHVQGSYFCEYELTDQKPIRTLTVEQYREEQNKAFKDYMSKCKTEDLQLSWRTVCTDYVREFCRRHEYKYDPDAWIGGDIGTVIEIADMFVSMDNIRYDVDNTVNPELFKKWYWKSVELYELGVDNYMNYPSYCKGDPDEWTEERMEVLRQAHKRVQAAQENLEKTIEEYKSNKMSF